MVAWGGCLFHGSRSAHVFCLLLPCMVSCFDRHALELSLCPWRLTSAWGLEGHLGPVRAARLQAPRPCTPIGTWPPSPTHRESSRAACEVYHSPYTWHPPRTRPLRSVLVAPNTPTRQPHGSHDRERQWNDSHVRRHEEKEGMDRALTICACNLNMRQPAPLTRSSTRLPAWRSRSGWHLRPRA